MKRDRGLLAYPLRKVVRATHTSGGNPNTNPPRSIFWLECGHVVELPRTWAERKAFRCEECPRFVGKPLIDIL
jgi:hypothetical protein